MNRRVLPFGIAVELLTSLLLWGRAPTDSVRVWYPSVWAYMGEHLLPWGAANTSATSYQRSWRASFQKLPRRYAFGLFFRAKDIFQKHGLGNSAITSRFVGRCGSCLHCLLGWCSLGGLGEMLKQLTTRDQRGNQTHVDYRLAFMEGPGRPLMFPTLSDSKPSKKISKS
jgi:hypothetical protein